jgi:Fe-S-cluster-containing hydrogenase component 2
MKFDMPSCGGCRSCEMACSFHHTGKFEPSVSSLVVIDKEDSKGFTIELIDGNRNGRFSCDECEGLEVPICVEWCKQKDDLVEFLADFKKERSNK